MSSWPDAAWGTLPRTGASTRDAPLGNRAATERTSSVPTVDMSIRTWPGESAGASPAAPNRTCSIASRVASIEMTKSAPAAAVAGEDATAAEQTAGQRRAHPPQPQESDLRHLRLSPYVLR